MDVRILLPTGKCYRKRLRRFKGSRTNARRWGEAHERDVLRNGPPKREKEVPTLAGFKDRFLNDYARANRQKPSGISNKEITLRVHLIPQLGARRLNEISNADIQHVKAHMSASSPKTVNNALTCLSKLLKVAVEWGVIERMPCTIKLLKPGEGRMTFWEFTEYERLVAAASRLDSGVLVAVLLGGDAGLRAGEMRALRVDGHRLQGAQAVRGAVGVAGSGRDHQRRSHADGAHDHPTRRGAAQASALEERSRPLS
ncbi:MAG: hypothetical protein U1E63_15520, partial [Burkholderiales bacterium]